MQSVEVQWRVENQRPQNISTSASAEGELVHTRTEWWAPCSWRTGLTKKTKRETCSGQKTEVRWLKEWNFLKGIWEGLKGKAEYKLNHMSEVVYNYGVERYGVFQRGRKEKQGQAKSR